jgi:ABC-type Zn uptake system ZnuABC Zn-binding protein ZnuA
MLSLEISSKGRRRWRLPPRPQTSRGLALLAFMPAIVLLAAAGCTRSAAGAATGPDGNEDKPTLSVVTSITVLADLVKNVGGERVEVKSLVPSGADPNTFQPPHRDVLVVSEADVVFFNGLGLDRTLRNVVINAARSDLPLVMLTDGLPTLDSGFSSDPFAPPGPTRGNPYLWLDPRNAIVYVERIRDTLGAIDPSGAATYQANAASYLERLRALDAELEAQLAVIPPEHRKLVVLHDAFPYLAQRYGFELVAVTIKTPGREPSAQEVADVSRAVRQYEVPTVFTEPQLNARLLKLAARDANIKIGTLYSDSLDHHVPTYEALLRYNARQLVSGLK